MMTVADLLEQLQTFDPSLRVLIEVDGLSYPVHRIDKAHALVMIEADTWSPQYE